MIYVKKYHNHYLYLSVELFRKLNSDYIQVLTNKKTNEVAFVPCKESDDQAVLITKHLDVTGQISRKVICSLFEKDKKYKGKYYKKDNCVIIKGVKL